MARTKLIAANWKMYKTPAEAREFMSVFLPLVAGHTRDEICICPPAVDIPAVVEAAKGSGIFVGAQNMFYEKEGAFTGELSPGMLIGAGCTHVIIGHSERRQYFGETDDTVNRTVEVALEAGLTPIMCIGEVIEEREAGLTDEVLRRQVTRGLRGISGRKAAKLVIAYEPVWAIGTGKTATPEIAEEAHSVIRAEVVNVMGREVAEKMRILYGGSVKPENAKALMAQEDIDGALVGGASLKPDSFAAIVKY
jgi:triosephosphate isomerase (TIM)